MKQIATIALASLLTLQLAGCSEKDEPATTDTERGIAIESISAIMQGMESNNGTTTRATQAGFSVNTSADPSNKAAHLRNWKMDFTLYNGNAVYPDGSFSNQDCTADKWIVSGKYFPNYKKPQAEALVYPNGWNNTSPNIAHDQSATGGTDLLAQDVLFRAKATIEVAHKVTIEVQHQHSMLDFVIKNVVRSEISSVVVFVGDVEYKPYPVKETAISGTLYDLEYMLILPQATDVSPVVQIKTKADTGNNITTITYKQTIGIISGSKTELGSNKCYCFTLQGAELKISPVTVLNWATGESLPGEYIAVTAYPTFKAEGHANETYYFYYDSKLKEGGKSKLQEIKFNENAECTIKPDGRILTHIYKPDDVEPIAGSKNMTPKAGSTPTTPNIVLSQMIIDLQSKLPIP